MKAIIGKKVGMSQIFDANGQVIPVTVIEAGPCVVSQKEDRRRRTATRAIQLGYEDVPERKLSKPEQGHLQKAGVAPKKHLKEFKLDNYAELNIGDIIKADTFAEGDHVDVTGISKGKGYAGVSSAGMHSALPCPTAAALSIVMPVPWALAPLPPASSRGKIGAGHLGVEQVTVQNLDVVKVDPDLNMIVVRGAIPGPKGGLVYLHSTVKTIRVKNTDVHQQQPAEGFRS